MPTQVIRSLIFNDRLFALAGNFVHQTEKCVRTKKTRTQFRRLASLHNSLGVAPREIITESQIRVDDCRKWIKLDRATHFSDGLVELTERRKDGNPEEVVSVGVVRVQRDCEFKFLLRSF